MAEKKLTFGVDLVSDLADILNKTDLTEIEVEQGELRVRVSREPAPQMMNYSAAPVSAPAPMQAAAAPEVPASKPAPAGSEVPSPMVGTAYMASSPDAAPFVSVGTKVSEGDTLLIIEAMKVMNQIPSPRSGTITAVLVSDGEPVEFAQPLVVIE